MIRSSISLCKLNLPTTSAKFHYDLVRRFAVAVGYVSGKKKETVSDKPNFNIGTIGHIDHGKTTLTSAITKVLSERGAAKFVEFDKIDKAKEEKKRGITINIAHVGYESPNRRYAHTDCPGHRDYIKNMITGTQQMDASILVIAADDGVMPQTREHLLLARKIGLEHIVVFINKCDKVDKDTVELVEIEAMEILEDFGFDISKCPIVKGSALAVLQCDDKTECIDELIAAIDSIPTPSRAEDLPFLFPISSRVYLPDDRLVAVGTVEQGIIKRREPVELQGFGRRLKSVVDTIQVFGKPVEQAKAGEHCGILLKGVKKDDTVLTGMWMGKPGSLLMANAMKTEFYLLPKEESGRQKGASSGFLEMVFCTSWHVPAKFHFDRQLVMPGETAGAWMFVEQPMPCALGTPFIVRDNSVGTELAYGRITHIYEPLDRCEIMRPKLFKMTEWIPKLKVVAAEKGEGSKKKK